MKADNINKLKRANLEKLKNLSKTTRMVRISKILKSGKYESMKNACLNKYPNLKKNTDK